MKVWRSTDDVGARYAKDPRVVAEYQKFTPDFGRVLNADVDTK